MEVTEVVPLCKSGRNPWQVHPSINDDNPVQKLFLSFSDWNLNIFIFESTADEKANRFY